MKLDDASAVSSLMSPADYKAEIGSEYLMFHIYVDGSLGTRMWMMKPLLDGGLS